MPKIYFASDHAGFALKNALLEYVRVSGYEAQDMGAFILDPADDYPDFVTPCAKEVSREQGAFGIIIGGSGQGEAMCANRISGVRAAIFYGEMRVTNALDVEGGHSEDGYDLIRLARRHNNANILSIGARFVSGEEAVEAVRIFLSTPFSNAPRHMHRLAKF
jgi:ribose 5-phosphate isomerase B